MSRDQHSADEFGLLPCLIANEVGSDCTETWQASGENEKTPQAPKWYLGRMVLGVLAQVGLFLTDLGCSSMACCLMCTFVGEKLRFHLSTDIHYIGTPGV